ncbi:MATE family efflux transporter [Caproiciproducens sp. AGMB10547]|uniref:Probable multidrug resistance protein NorM n=1 Tax=Caproiciproducens faecalis TaxID=2820301 RepID=A0ABS7DK98_9FIRM|nr:MATE family efflux transporter [Caproiciproducens faecalis]MBW7571721.1 MATE family efflux transporter [Caproiciproducens faecalis]
MEKTENKMGTMSVFPLIISMSVPAMLSMLVQAMYNVVDSFFVAKVSENALTAVSLAFPIQTLLIALAVGTSVGINSLVSRRLGERRQEKANSAATHGILLGAFNWAIFALVGLLFSEPFFRSFTANEEIITMGTQYMSIVCIVSMGVFIEINIEKTLQATGNMIYPMLSQILGAVTNIILDPIFIFGLLGVPKMGVAGAAIATVIGQIFAMLFLIYIIVKKDHQVVISFRNFKLDFSTIRDIYSVGFPSIIMQAIGSVMVVGMNAILIGFTETAVALFGVYFKLQSFVFMPVFGLMQGVMPIIGYNFGARRRDRLLSTVRIGSIISVVIMAIGTALFWLIPDRLLLIFNASRLMLEIGVPALHTISICFVPAALGIMFSTVFQAVGSGFKSLIISVLRQLIVLLPAAFLLSKIGLPFVWYAFPIAEGASLIASIVFYLQLYKKRLKTL